MTPKTVQDKLDALTLKGITISRTSSPFGAVLTGECKIGERVVAATQLIDNITLAETRNVYHVVIEALNTIEATLGKAGHEGK